MYKVLRRENLIPFFVLLCASLTAVICLPSLFPDQVLEIPAFTLYPGEIALALILSVLFYENASPGELFRLSFSILAISMFAGTVCNWAVQTSQTLPDSTLLLNWVQLITMNLAGLLSTLGLYETKLVDRASVLLNEPVIRKTATTPASDTLTPVGHKPDVQPTTEPLVTKGEESAKDILEKLDVNRINELEQSLKPTEAVSLESLFADESRAAAKSSGKGVLSLEATPSAPDATSPEPWLSLAQDQTDLKSETSDPLVKLETTTSARTEKLFEDVGTDLDNIFSGLASEEAQQDFSEAKLASLKAEAKTHVKAKEPEPLLKDVEGELDDIFANIVSQEAQKEVSSETLSNIQPHVQQGIPTEPADTNTIAPLPSNSPAQPTSSKQARSFGRLSAVATEAASRLSSPGTLKTIGQMLLDRQAVETIIEHADKENYRGLTAKVLTVARGENIQELLSQIASYPQISGSLLVGHDGLCISSTDSVETAKDLFSPLSLAIHSSTGLGIDALEMGKLATVVLKSQDKLTVLTEVDMGILAVFSNETSLSCLNDIVNLIETSVVPSQVLADFSPDQVSSAPLNIDSAAQESLPSPEPTSDLITDANATLPSTLPLSSQSEQIDSAQNQNTVLNITDQDVSDIFDKLILDPEKAKSFKSKDKEQQESNKEQQGTADGLLNLTDDDISGIFDQILNKEPDKPSLASNEPAPAVSSLDFRPPSNNENNSATSAAVASASDGEKEVASLGNQAIDSKPEVTSVSHPESARAEDTVKAPANTTSIKEFGRLSAQATSTQASSQDTGTIKAIGKQLIDVQAIENIIKAGQSREKMSGGLTNARVISTARGEGIKTLLTNVDTCPGVIGSLIVGNDGLVIASTLTGGLDKDMLGALCNAIHSHSDLATEKLRLGKLRQAILYASDKLTILTAVAVGVLAVFVEHYHVDQLDALLTAIETTVRG